MGFPHSREEAAQRIPPPTADLIAILRACLEARGRDRVPLEPVGGWPGLLREAAEQRLAGTLFAALGEEARSSLPTEVALELKRAYLEQWSRNARLLRSLSRLAAAFRRAKIPVVFYKGPLLALHLHGSLGARSAWDLDLLIPTELSFARLDHVLRDAGYRRRSKLPLPETVTRRLVNQLEYEGPAGVVEPHWSLRGHPAQRLDERRIRESAASRSLRGGEVVRTLSAEDTLLAYALALPADLQNDALRLRTFYESALLARRLGDELAGDDLWQRRRREGTSRLVATLVAASTGLFSEGGASSRLEIRRARPDADELVSLVARAGRSRSSREARRRRLAMRLLDLPAARLALWWTLSLPARIAAHPRVTIRRSKEVLGSWRR